MEYFKKLLEFIRRNRVLKHLLFWILIYIINIPAGLLEDADSLFVILMLNSCVHIPQILTSYFFAYYLIPRLTIKKEYVFTLLLFLLSTYIFVTLARILTVHVGEELFRARPFSQESVYEILTDMGTLLIQYLPAVYNVSFQFLFLKYFISFKETKDKEILLSKEKIEAELKVLKAQLNPHFLFNTLNNIYSLSLDNSPKAPVAIEKLSEILDHILYKCNSDVVTLSTEIDLLKNYIELEKLRYNERLEVVFETHLENDIQIPPLLLLSLVENAFKHGAGEDSGSPKIAIEIIQKDFSFQFKISNTISENYASKDKAKIGLSNIRKQLDLIYSDKYSLDIKQTLNLFTVVLKIN